MKFTGKWMDLENMHPEKYNSDTGGQTQYVSESMWTIAVKSLIIRVLVDRE